jgi:hypothetical protein
MRLHRYDGTAPDKKRLATAQELTAYDAAIGTEQAQAEINGADRKMMKAAVLWIAGKLGVDPAVAVQEIIAIRKTL